LASGLFLDNLKKFLEVGIGPEKYTIFISISVETLDINDQELNRVVSYIKQKFANESSIEGMNVTVKELKL
jgi:hypothetical protein